MKASYYSGITNMVNYIMTSVTAYNPVTLTFDTGENDDQAVTGDGVYPMFFLLQPFRSTTDEKLLTWNMSYTITDKQALDKSDEEVKLHETRLISERILQKFREDKEFNLGGIITHTSLVEYSDVNTAGWLVEFDFTQAIPVDSCLNSSYFN